MATVQQPDTRTQLEDHISQWNARWRLQRVVRYFPLVMIIALLAAMVVSLVFATVQVLTLVEMLVLTGIVLGATLVIGLSALGLWSKRGIEAARRFDALFGLQERMTTAFELLDGRITTTEEISTRQLSDAVRRADEVDANEALPLEFDPWLWVGMLCTLLVAIFVIAFAALQVGVNRGQGISAQTTAAIDAAADTARDITEGVATDSALTPEERQALLDSTEQTIDELESPDITPEESFAAMSDLESDLRDEADAIRQEVQASETRLQNTADTLSGNQGEGTSPENRPTLSDAITTLETDLADATPEEQAELEERLRDAAAEVEEESPDLAEDLEEAADAVSDGDIARALESLEEFAQSAADEAMQNQARSESADDLDAAADSASAASEQIATTEFSNEANVDAEVNDTGRDVEDIAPSANLGIEENMGSSPSEAGGQPQEGDEGRSVASDQEGAQAGNAPQSSGDNDTSSPQEQGGQDGDESGQGGTAGENASTERSQEPSGSDSDDSDNSGGGTDGGETEYESVFSPPMDDQAAGDTTIELEAEPDSASVEGEFQNNPDGTSSVPYNQVFGTYSEAASAALDTGYVPLGVRDVVRDYFISIEPTGGTADDITDE